MANGRSQLSQLLDQFARATALKELKLDKDNCCTLQFDGEMEVTIEFVEVGEFVMLSAPVGDYDAGTELAALRDVASANFHWLGTGGATLAANTDQRRVFLQYREPVESVDWPRFSQLLEGFLNTLEMWRGRLGREPAAKDSSAAGQLREAAGLRA